MINNKSLSIYLLLIFPVTVIGFILIRNFQFNRTREGYTGAPQDFVDFESKRELYCPVWTRWETAKGENFAVVSVNCPLNENEDNVSVEKVLVEVSGNIGQIEFEQWLEDNNISLGNLEIEYIDAEAI